MYHSITFGDRNTWDDWHLIPQSRPLFNPPQVKTAYVEVPGGDGILDLTTALSGRPLYRNRSGSIEFIAENGFRDWAFLYSEIMAYLHGKRMRAVLEDDPGYYYEGRFTVNAWKSDPNYSVITIDYDVGPYKIATASSTSEWLWDPFNFLTGMILYYKDLPINGTRVVTVIGSAMPVIPEILVSDTGFSMEYEGVVYSLSKGFNRFDDVVIGDGGNLFTFTGVGTVTIEYSGGIL